VGTLAVLAIAATAGALAPGGNAHADVPIRHVVILFQENHSFDNVFGKFCTEVAGHQITRAGLGMGCDGVVTGKNVKGKSVPLTPAPDLVPNMPHSIAAQQVAINGGQMGGYSKINGCKKKQGYACYATYDPSSIPNLSQLAEQFAMSDRTFEFRSTPSWGGHLVMAAATTDGFSGDNPTNSTFTTKRGPGWGCDSYRDAPWWNGSEYVPEPACVPDAQGNGPYRPSPVQYVPTIFDRLDAAGLSWKIYASGPSGDTDVTPYGWDICPSFFECLGGPQHNNLVPTGDVVTDAGAGTLPSFSIVTPSLDISQHNGYSMAQGDNWIGNVVSAIENGSDWDSTAIFIVYDDFGGFYDHVNPLQYDPNWGIRLPVVIVSPYAKAGYTDSTPASLVSFLAYTEHVFGLPSLNSSDGFAYDFSSSFDYSQQPLAPATLTHTAIPRAERRYIAHEPPPLDDPT
jgi:phospholipase C